MKSKFALLFLALTISLLAQNNNRDKANDDIYSSRQTIITKTVKEVSPAVVGINVTEIREYQDARSYDPFWRYFYGDGIIQREIKGLGSGVIISSDGYVLTNDHVVNGEKVVTATVTLTDGRKYDAKIVGSDHSSDICLLKINATNLPYLKFGNSEDVLIGEWVVALGNPFGLFDVNDKPTVTVGVISNTNMLLPSSENRYYVNMIQTDAAINPGNSGGPLVNALGELIGMNTIIAQSQDASRYGLNIGSIGVGFAIPANKIQKISEELKQKSKVDREFITGLNILTVDENFAKTYNLFVNCGVIISQIIKNSPADKCGLKVEDIIVSLDGYKINNIDSFISYINEFRTGDEIEIKFIRGEKEMTKKMKLEKTK